MDRGVNTVITKGTPSTSAPEMSRRASSCCPSTPRPMSRGRTDSQSLAVLTGQFTNCGVSESEPLKREPSPQSSEW